MCIDLQAGKTAKREKNWEVPMRDGERQDRNRFGPMSGNRVSLPPVDIVGTSGRLFKQSTVIEENVSGKDSRHPVIRGVMPYNEEFFCTLADFHASIQAFL